MALLWGEIRLPGGGLLPVKLSSDHQDDLMPLSPALLAEEAPFFMPQVVTPLFRCHFKLLELHPALSYLNGCLALDCSLRHIVAEKSLFGRLVPLEAASNRESLVVIIDALRTDLFILLFFNCFP
jgi:hypothetical protein